MSKCVYLNVSSYRLEYSESAVAQTINEKQLKIYMCLIEVNYSSIKAQQQRDFSVKFLRLTAKECLHILESLITMFCLYNTTYKKRRAP